MNVGSLPAGYGKNVLTLCIGIRMSDYTPVKDCLEAARNGRFCAGAESAMREIERLTDALEQAQAVNETADSMCKWIQRELEQHDGWHQFDFLPVKFDLFWFYQLEKALQSIGSTCKHPSCDSKGICNECGKPVPNPDDYCNG